MIRLVPDLGGGEFLRLDQNNIKTRSIHRFRRFSQVAFHNNLRHPRDPRFTLLATNFSSFTTSATNLRMPSAVSPSPSDYHSTNSETWFRRAGESPGQKTFCFILLGYSVKQRR